MKSKDQTRLEGIYESIRESQQNTSMMKFKLFFLTPEGCEWLEQTFESHSIEHAQKLTREWYHLNQPTAHRLVDGWLRNGETEETAALWPNVSCEDREIEQALSKYLDEITE